MEIEDYSLDLQQAVLARAELTGEEAFLERSFVHISLDHLAEVGEVDDATVCLHRALGIQVSGWAVSELRLDEDGPTRGESLDLFVAIHTNEVPPRTVLKSEMIDAFKRVRKFLVQCTEGYFKNIEEATDTFDLAQMIFAEWRNYSRVRFVLLTDGICRNDPPPVQMHDGLRISYDIWDAERFFRSWSSGREREEIEIDFVKLTGSGVPCLRQDNLDGGYSTFLAIFPGTLLVELYGRYGPRLLERNVRSFLQAKGAINRGIRDTIKIEPNMFLAFNNGLSCTASSVEVEVAESGGTALKTIRDLQIVNGGQTTASIYHASVKDKVDVKGIGVQVKLTILNDASQMDEIVPRISKYANSQNKVQVADLMANDKFHRRIEELSRTIWAPARDGTLRQTRWFYERARGQYRDDIARERTPAKIKEFETTHPKLQMFTKTDLAKYVLTYSSQPHIVSKGAQFAFSSFTVGLEAHVKSEGQIDQGYFERLVAKAILFRETERIVKEAKFPGYRANIVTYTIAKLAFLLKGKIDLNRIWREQSLYGGLDSAISKISSACYTHIVEGASGGNVTQYCKKEDCWNTFRDSYVSLPDEAIKKLSTISNVPQTSDQIETGAESIALRGPIFEVGKEGWLALAKFGTDRSLFTPKQMELIVSVSLAIGEGKSPSAKVAEIAMALYATASQHGFVLK